MIRTFQNGVLEVKEITELLSDREEKDMIYMSLSNELLIKTYTTYEKFLKGLLDSIFSDAKKVYLYRPLLTNHKMNSEEKKFYTPSSKKGDIARYFPLFKKSIHYNSLLTVDTIIDERNKYAHTGSHIATEQQILQGFMDIQYIVRFLYEFYRLNDGTTYDEIDKYFNSEKCFLCKIKEISEIIDSLKSGNRTVFPDKVQSKIEKCSELQVKFINNYRGANVARNNSLIKCLLENDELFN